MNDPYFVRYRDQGVQTSFYESTPSTRDPVGNTISPGARGNSGYAGTNIPNAPEERENGGVCKFPRILLPTCSWYANLQDSGIQ